jgi:hypothetical protein
MVNHVLLSPFVAPMVDGPIPTASQAIPDRFTDSGGSPSPANQRPLRPESHSYGGDFRTVHVPPLPLRAVDFDRRSTPVGASRSFSAPSTGGTSSSACGRLVKGVL